MLQYATAVPGPLRLEVNSREAGTEAVDIEQPFAVIGRHPSCDIVINNPAVSSRHVYLQAIGPRIAAIDLHSRSGTDWQDPEFSGWLTHAHGIKIPGAWIQLRDSFWTKDGTLTPPLDFRPREEHRAEYGALPQVNLELLNTSAKGKMWPINRVITLIGRDERCRITVMDKRISRIHCSLLLLPSGLWVIDLTGQGGFQINGQECACGMLAEGAEFKLGPYILTARYASVPSAMTVAEQEMESGEWDFLTQQNRIFKTKLFGDIIVISPLGDSQEFFYQDIHNEASRVLETIRKRDFQHVVIDFSKSQAVGHIIIESLVSFCRTAPGKAALCACTVGTYEALQTTKLFNIWPHYQTRQEALYAVSLPE